MSYEEIEKLLLTFNVHCEQIVVDYLNGPCEKMGISEYSIGLIESGVFDKIISNKDTETLATAYIEIIHSKLIGKMSFEEWIGMMFDRYDFLVKLKSYKIKYDLLHADTSKIGINQILLDMFNRVADGLEFEEFLHKFYTNNDYSVTRTPKTGDQGADLVLAKNGEVTVVQAKFYNSPVGNGAVQEVVAAKGFYNADRAIVVTNNVFTKSAMDLALANNVSLIDGNTLINMIQVM